jgi:hypothetical protein
MTRLRDEIVSSRHSRLAFRGELGRQTEERRSQVSELCSAFSRDRAEAHSAWFGRTTAERQAAGREGRRELAVPTAAKTPAEPQPPAVQEPRKREAVASVAVPFVRPPAATFPPAHKSHFKGSKKR